LDCESGLYVAKIIVNTLGRVAPSLELWIFLSANPQYTIHNPQYTIRRKPSASIQLHPTPFTLPLALCYTGTLVLYQQTASALNQAASKASRERFRVIRFWSVQRMTQINISLKSPGQVPPIDMKAKRPDFIASIANRYTKFISQYWLYKGPIITLQR
jgi:hypothetical protein